MPKYVNLDELYVAGYRKNEQVTIDIYNDGTYSYICPCGAEVEWNQKYCDTCGQYLSFDEAKAWRRADDA